jgi:hypothetical protein
MYYPPGSHGPGSPALIGLPEGYFAQQADGSWQWTEEPNRDAGGGAGAGNTGLIDFSSLLEQLSHGGLINTPTYTPTPIDKSTIPWLQHPETYSPELIGELESRNSEQQMVAGQAADEDLARFGAAHDLGASPWLAAGRAGNLYSTRQNIISGTREIDTSRADPERAGPPARGRDDRRHRQVQRDDQGSRPRSSAISVADAARRTCYQTLLTLYERQQEFGGELQLSYDELQRLLNNDALGPDARRNSTGE